jgi:predicted nuclease of predicted toxin-antitoxin system
MKFKIDENLPGEIAELLCQKGHEAITVVEQNMGGENDRKIASVCRLEKRILITLDTDFSNIRTYPPEKFPGIVVLRLQKQDKSHVLNVFTSLIDLFPKQQIKSHLWIVDEKRVRIRGNSA